MEKSEYLLILRPTEFINIISSTSAKPLQKSMVTKTVTREFYTLDNI